MDESILKKLLLPDELMEVITTNGIEIIIPETREEIMELALGGKDNYEFDVKYDVNGKEIKEAVVIKCKNAIVANYTEAYMRRRDPNCMYISDDLPTDKVTYKEKFGESFDRVRGETFEWLKEQKSLIFLPFLAGNDYVGVGYESVSIIPTNAAFFAAALADLQGFIPKSKIADEFNPKAIVYVAPPFRHTHYDGKQVVVHNRGKGLHEVFSYNLYPGPSAKKGIYGVLLNLGEQEEWVTLHASTVRVTTPYELTVTIMHEGASGGGKSEMLEHFHREKDGKFLLGTNTENQEKYYVPLSDSCQLEPVTDDMAMNHPSIQNDSSKLVVVDAEEGWFLRVDHITKYGTEPATERNSIHPKKPLVFLNIDAVPKSTALIWEPIMDEDNKPCPNPRIIMPRSLVDDCINEPVEVDIRSFGLRQPPNSRLKPSYGIAGIFHILPPALAWLWRLASPRGHANPSIVDTGGMKSEGVGSYWPFATGKKVTQANLLLEQILKTPSTRYILVPNQYIGVYHVGFSGQWVAREYLSRRGGVKFRPGTLKECRCPILGYTVGGIKIDGQDIRKRLMEVNLQSEVGNEGYDEGAKILTNFFKSEIIKYYTDDLHPLGKQIIDICLNDGTVQDYYDLIPKL